jgi:hypothetical protein
MEEEENQRPGAMSSSPLRLHGPGIVQAVKALAAKDKSRILGNHPFGGVLEIQLNE